MQLYRFLFTTVRVRKPLVLGALLCVLLLSRGWAQSTQGSIVGTVKDTTGALVPGAPVTLTNTSEGTVRTTKSNGAGDYAFLDVKAGRYAIAIEAPGFEKWSITGAVLNTQQELRIDASLVIGSVDQTVTVSADAVTAIETDTPSIAAVYSATDVSNLPVNTRASAAGTSAYNIVGSLSGVQPDGGSANNSTLSFSVQGGLPFESETSVDGVTVRSATGGNRAIGDAFPSSESMRRYA